jgi:acyl carrier protein
MDSEHSTTQWLCAELASTLDRPIGEIDPDMTFAQLGVDSGLATHLLIALEDKLNIELDPDVVFELPTLRSLAAYAIGLVPIGSRS